MIELAVATAEDPPSRAQQCTVQETYTEAIDIWSIGCIYAELLRMLEGTKMED